MDGPWPILDGKNPRAPHLARFTAGEIRVTLETYQEKIGYFLVEIGKEDSEMPETDVFAGKRRQSCKMFLRGPLIWGARGDFGNDDAVGDRLDFGKNDGDMGVGAIVMGQLFQFFGQVRQHLESGHPARPL